MRPSDKTTLDHSGRLCAKPSRVPDYDIRQLAHLNAANEMTEPLGKRSVDGILADIPLRPEIVRPRPLVLLQRTPLNLVLVSSVPGPEDDFPAASHSLGVGAHHADGAEIVEHVFCCDRLGPDARFGEGNVLGDVLGEMVADHEHVEVLVKSVAGVGPGRVRRGGKDVGVLDHGDDVRCVATPSSFSVVGVNGAALEGTDRGLDEARLVESIGVDQTLHVELIADAQTRIDRSRCAAPILVEFEPTRSGIDHLAKSFRRAVVAFARDAYIQWHLIACLKHEPGVVLSRGASRGTCASTAMLSAGFNGAFAAFRGCKPRTDTPTQHSRDS